MQHICSELQPKPGSTSWDGEHSGDDEDHDDDGDINIKCEADLIDKVVQMMKQKNWTKKHCCISLFESGLKKGTNLLASLSRFQI